MEKQKKEKYEKPQLRVIELKADEVLGVGCKTLSGGATVTPPGCVGTGCGLVSGS